MQNRDLSWLKFNERVLKEATYKNTPDLERLRFISIYLKNLDEFFMIRVGNLNNYVVSNINYVDRRTGLDANSILDKVYSVVNSQYKILEDTFKILIKDLDKYGIKRIQLADVDKKYLSILKGEFLRDIAPLLSVQLIDERLPFPHLLNKKQYIILRLSDYKERYALIEIPDILERVKFVEHEAFHFLLLEDIILYFADLLFTDLKVVEKKIIAVTRNADIEIEAEDVDEDLGYKQFMNEILIKRSKLAAVRLEVCYGKISDDLLHYLLNHLHLEQNQYFVTNFPFDFSYSNELISKVARFIDSKHLSHMLWQKYIPKEVINKDESVIDAVFKEDVLLSYPYDAMSPFLRMLKEAAFNERVKSISITIYRMDIHSKIGEYLILAAENKKEVNVIMEIRARFDETNNIDWAAKLEDAGCNIHYGPSFYKIHSKICLITLKGKGKNREEKIAQIGTGNYNEATAKVYTDYALITANKDITNDAKRFFKNMFAQNIDGAYKSLWVAPHSLETNIIKYIERETTKALNKKKARIIIKCNSLTDQELMKSLVKASQAGVKITLIIRGICCLTPKLKGLTHNIEVISIVGRLLEHTRVYVFGHENPDVYIASADLMDRNMEKRVEIAAPIYDIKVKAKILKMLDIMMKDNTKAWELKEDENYYLKTNNKRKINSQEYFMKNINKL